MPLPSRKAAAQKLSFYARSSNTLDKESLAEEKYNDHRKNGTGCRRHSQIRPIHFIHHRPLYNLRHGIQILFYKEDQRTKVLVPCGYEAQNALPFNRERYDDPSRRFLVTVTDCRTGAGMYCEKGVTQDFSKALRASASMPFVSEMVEVEGVPCLDGGCAVKIPYRWAIENGFEKILVVRTRPADYVRPPESKRFMELSQRIYKSYPNLVERLNSQSQQYNNACRELAELEAAGKLMMLCPSGSISVSTLEGDMERLGALYLLGRADTKLLLPKIRAYFGLIEEKEK